MSAEAPGGNTAGSGDGTAVAVAPSTEPIPSPSPFAGQQSPNTDCFDCGGGSRPVSDQSVLVSCYLGIILGVVSLTAFTLLWRHVKVYQSRQYLRQVAFKPPDIPSQKIWGWELPWRWLHPVLNVTTEDILIAAGFDAVITLKTIEFGVQLFGPIAIICLVILVPVHLAGNELDGSAYQAQSLAFARFTTANLRGARDAQSNMPGIYWLHLVLAFVFVFYCLYLVHYHYVDLKKLKILYAEQGENHHDSALAKRSAWREEHPEKVNLLTADQELRAEQQQQAQAQQSAQGSTPPDTGIQDGVLNNWLQYQKEEMESAAQEARESVVPPLPARPSTPGAGPGFGNSPWDAGLPLACRDSDRSGVGPGASTDQGGLRGIATAWKRTASKAARPAGVSYASTSTFQPGAFSATVAKPPASARGGGDSMWGRSRAGSAVTSRRASVAGSIKTGDLFTGMSHQRPRSQWGEHSQADGSSPRGRPRASPATTMTPAASTPPGSVSPQRQQSLDRRPRSQRGVADLLRVGSQSFPVRVPSTRGEAEPIQLRTSDGGELSHGAPLPLDSGPDPGNTLNTLQPRHPDDRSASQRSDAKQSPSRQGRHRAQPSFADGFGGNMPDLQPDMAESPKLADTPTPRAPSRMSGTGSAAVSIGGGHGGAERKSQPETPTLARFAALHASGDSVGDRASSSGASMVYHSGSSTAGAAATPEPEASEPARVAAPGDAETSHSQHAQSRLRRSGAGPVAESGNGGIDNMAMPPENSSPPRVSDAALAPPRSRTTGLMQMTMEDTRHDPEASTAHLGGAAPAHGPPQAHSTAGDLANNSIDLGAVQAQTHSTFKPPPYRQTRPPMIDIGGARSEAGSMAPSQLFTQYEPGGQKQAYQAITNDINVVEADQHMQEGVEDEDGEQDGPGPDGKPGKQSTPNGRSSAPDKWWLTQAMREVQHNENKLVKTAKESHEDWWWDPAAILSRKPSVRFRRSVNIVQPKFDDEGNQVGIGGRRAIEMQKYVVLVTDVPVARSREQLRAKKAAELEGSLPPGGPMMESLVTNDSAELHSDALYALQESVDVDSEGSTMDSMHLHKWLPAFWQRSAMGGGAVATAAPARVRPAAPQRKLPPRPQSCHLDTYPTLGARRGGRSSFDFEALPPRRPIVQRRQRARSMFAAEGVGEGAEEEEAELCSAPPVQPPMSAAAAADLDEEALFAELGLAGGGASPLRVNDNKRHEGPVTDLRSRAARERMGALLKRTGFEGPQVLEGEAAKQVWGSMAARATLPPHLQRELADYLAAKRRGHGAAGAASSGSAPPQRGPAPAAVAEGSERPRSAGSGHGAAQQGSADAGPGPPTSGGKNARFASRSSQSIVLKRVPETDVADAGSTTSPPVVPIGSGRPRSATAAVAVNASSHASTSAPAPGTSGSTNGGVPVPHQAQDLAQGTPFLSHHKRNTSMPMTKDKEVWLDEDHDKSQLHKGVHYSTLRRSTESGKDDGSDAPKRITTVTESSDERGENVRLRDMMMEQLESAFQEVFLDTNTKLVPILNHRAVHLQLIKWDALQMQLESVEHREKVALEKWKRRKGQSGKPTPIMKKVGGRFGIGGHKVEERSHVLGLIKECEEAIDKAREDTYNSVVANSFFVIFNSQFAATIAVQCVLHSLDARMYRTRAAPAPDNINWPTLFRSNGSRRWRRPVAFLLYTLIMCVPIGIFGGLLTQLANVLCEDSQDGEVSSGFAGFCGNGIVGRVATQVLPAVLVILWQNAIMPLALYGITLFESTHVSLSQLDRRILVLFFWWNALNVFLGSMIAGSIAQQIQTLIERPSSITEVFGESLPGSSNFFINYLALRSFGLVPFRLILVHGGIWRWLFKCGGKCCVTTARDEAAFMAPASIRYGREIGVMMLVLICAWAYCLVSPILIVIAAIYFMSSWVVWRWQVIYVYVRCYEGGGDIWRSIVSCIMSSMLIFAFFMTCVFVAKQAFYQAAICFLVLPVIIVGFWRHFRLKHDPPLKYVPLEVAARAPCVNINPMSYIAAPLRPKCAGWHPEWGKAWESWGAPSYPIGG